MKAFVFPGQGAQFPGMGKELYDNIPSARAMFDEADRILGFSISEIMFSGTEDDLRQTRVTQPAVFLHSVILAAALADRFRPDMVAGHSLGEFSALTAAGALDFAEGLTLVAKRAAAMQAACEAQPSTMAAVLGLPEGTVEEVCSSVAGTVVAANYNCPGQIVISGSVEAVEAACEALKEAGAKRAVRLSVGGAFHSPLMEPARAQLEKAISEAVIRRPVCPVYQNVDARAHTEPAQIKRNLAAQLTAPVLWTQTVLNMSADGADHYTEVGPGNVLQGLIRKIDRNVAAISVAALE